LFSFVAYKTQTFHKVLDRSNTGGAVSSLVRVLLQNFSWSWQWKRFQINIWWSYKTYKKCAKFFGPPYQFFCSMVIGL